MVVDRYPDVAAERMVAEGRDQVVPGEDPLRNAPVIGVGFAFAPAEAPQLAVAVLVENGRSGSGTAAPIARKVFDAFLLPPAAVPSETETPVPVTGSEE